MSSTEANGIQIEVETRGADAAPAFLLIRGLSTQLIQWPEVFLDRLVGEGFRVVVFDNRDCGLSQKFEAAGTPSVEDVLAGRVEAPYSIADMALDAVGVLDTLGIETAHVGGISLGGMVAQHLAFSHGERFRSVTSVMSSSGARGLPSGKPEAMAVLTTRPSDPHDREAVIAHQMRGQAVIGSPRYPQTPEERRRYCERAYDRCYCPTGTARQMTAALTDATRAERLVEVTIPFQVLHGSDDPLLPLACGEDTAKRVPRAEFVVIEGMGHDVTNANAPILAEKLIAFARANA